MKVFKVLMVASLALAAGAMAEHVRADEIFICGDGRQVRAKSVEIEHLKRTDPCVAAHYGVAQVAVVGKPDAANAGPMMPPANPRRTGLRRETAPVAARTREEGEIDLSNLIILNAAHTR
ncbi:MAG: hypothetical protein RLZ98_2886 [Pseudomonadota bacterium]